MATSTILDILTEGRDEPDSSKMKATSTRGSQKYLHTDVVKDWTEFTYDNILLAFGEFLTQPVTEPFPERRFMPDTKTPQDEAAIMDIARDLTLNTVLYAVNVTARKFPGHFPRAPNDMTYKRQYPIRNLNHDATSDKAKERKQPLRSDWGFFYAPGAEVSCSLKPYQDDDTASQTNTLNNDVLLVVGEAKKSTNWSFNDLIKALEEPKGSRSYRIEKRKLTKRPASGDSTKDTARKPILVPTDQLGTYCVWSRTALGFLHTDKELLVCNTKCIRNSRGRKTRAGMKVLRTCWKPNYDRGTITPELALFCILTAAYYRDNSFPVNAYSHEDIIIWHRVCGQYAADEDVKYRNKFSGLMRPYSQLKKHRSLIFLEADDW